MAVKVSVCIPVYGVEKYIEKCARTLFEQTLPEIEFIFVDDCSPDRSIEILQRVLSEYPHRKEQVKIIRHEVNQGVGAARNHAVAACTGEYVIHCDPDDWVELDMYEVMYNKAKESDADMVYCSYVQEYPNGKRCYGKISFGDDPVVFLNRMYSGKTPGYLWRALYKNKIALHESINCPDDICMYEDILRHTYMLPLCKKIIGVSQRFYHYRNNAASICKQKDTESVLKKLDGMKKIIAISQKYNLSDEVILQRKLMELLYCVGYGTVSSQYKNIFPEAQKKILSSNIRFDIKIVLLVAQYSYRTAFVLDFCRVKILSLLNRIRFVLQG